LTDCFSKSFDGLFGRFDRELAVILAEIPAEEIEAFINVYDKGFITR
jgi:hypothetical protein